ncbi:MAG: family 10 glycosylhydrolase [Armatimonadetes bacterium]|nr:family 10 glycosylhydrolase [Armatimonadota bacterium]
MGVRGLWCGPSDFGLDRATVSETVARVADHGFNLLLPEVKGGHGLLRYPSKRFAQAVQKPYDEFDFPAVLLEECRKRGVEVHAWFIDFFEGEDSPAFRAHPEWAARDAKGRCTNEEQLRGERFTGMWMCPAQHAGYSSEWLVPIYEEFAAMYDFDAVHHDYVRYPGDLAPDQYCFCDSCLQALPEWAGYTNPVFLDEPFDHALYDREYLEAHWEQSPRVLPAYWERLNRAERSRFLLEGSFFRYGRQDLDYFYYQFRKNAIRRFVDAARAKCLSARPSIQVSAAVFKNPIHSARFIGQAWNEWAGAVDTMIPMDYRDHYPGTMENYLGLLRETIGRQKCWSSEAGASRYLTGFALWPLVRGGELESNRSSHLRQVVQLVESENEEGWVMFCLGDLVRYDLWKAVGAA